MANQRLLSSHDHLEAEELRPHMSLAVIIPTIGKSKYLYNTLQSVFEQILTPNEIVVVWNGCSPPDWFSSVEKTAAQVNAELIQVYHQKQLDISVSWSSGAYATKADLLYFLGDDDLIDSDFFLIACEAFEHACSLDVFSTNVRYIDDDGRLMGKSFRGHDEFQADLTVIHRVTKESFWFYAPPAIFSSVFRRKTLEKIKFFPYHGLAFDVWMFHHLTITEGYLLAYLHSTKVSYRRSAASSSNQILRHALDYISGLVEFQASFNSLGANKAFRLVAVNFALTAIARSLKSPYAIACFLIKVMRMGFMSDLANAFLSRILHRLNYRPLLSLLKSKNINIL